jgi:hypothetical protein
MRVVTPVGTKWGGAGSTRVEGREAAMEDARYKGGGGIIGAYIASSGMFGQWTTPTCRAAGRWIRISKNRPIHSSY